MKVLKKNIVGILDYAFKIGFFHLMSANLLIQVAGFGMQFLLVRILSQEDIGRIAVLNSFYSVLVLLAQIGVNTAIVKLCSEHISKEEKDELVVTGFKLNVVSSLVIVLGVVIVSFFNIFSVKDLLINDLMRIYIFQLPFVILNYVAIAYLQSQSQIRKMSRFQILSRIVIILTLVIFSAIWGLKGYVFGIVLANGLAFAWISRVSLPKLATFRKYRWKKKTVKKMVNYSQYAFLATLVFQLINSSGVMLANYFVTDRAEIAKYSMAMLMINGLIMIPSSYNQIMVPKLSSISNDWLKVKGMIGDYRKKMFFLVLAMFVGAYIFVPVVIPLLLGEDYTGSIRYFKILAFGLFAWGVYSPIGNTMISIGRVKLNLISNVVIWIVLVITDLVLLPRLGVVSLAYGYVCSNIFGMLVNRWMLYRVYRKAGHV